NRISEVGRNGLPKTVGSAYVGSNPTPATHRKSLWGSLSCVRQTLYAAVGALCAGEPTGAVADAAQASVDARFSAEHEPGHPRGLRSGAIQVDGDRPGGWIWDGRSDEQARDVVLQRGHGEAVPGQVHPSHGGGARARGDGHDPASAEQGDPVDLD